VLEPESVKKRVCKPIRGSTRMFNAEPALQQGCGSPCSELRKGWACGGGLQPTPAVLSVPMGQDISSLF